MLYCITKGGNAPLFLKWWWVGVPSHVFLQLERMARKLEGVFSESKELGYFKKIWTLKRGLLWFYMNWKPFTILLNKKKTLNFLVFVLLRYRGSRILQRLLQNTVTWALCCFQILISFLPFSLFFPQSMEIRQAVSKFIFSFSFSLCYLNPLTWPEWPATDKNMNSLSENSVLKTSKKRCWEHALMFWHPPKVHLDGGVGLDLLSNSPMPHIHCAAIATEAAENHSVSGCHVLLSQRIALSPWEAYGFPHS